MTRLERLQKREAVIIDRLKEEYKKLSDELGFGDIPFAPENNMVIVELRRNMEQDKLNE